MSALVGLVQLFEGLIAWTKAIEAVKRHDSDQPS